MAHPLAVNAFKEHILLTLVDSKMQLLLVFIKTAATLKFPCLDLNILSNFVSIQNQVVYLYALVELLCLLIIKNLCFG